VRETIDHCGLEISIDGQGAFSKEPISVSKKGSSRSSTFRFGFTNSRDATSTINASNCLITISISKSI
jgi:hypothetical protein